MSAYICGGLAQLARASALHAGGQEFESPILHQIDKKLGQLIRDAINELTRNG